MLLLGKKVKMDQIWKDGKVIAVTVVEAEPNHISDIRTKDKNGYDAIQVSMGRHKKEYRTTSPSSVNSGDEITVELFKEGEKVKVSGITKGRGFQGTVKRYNFAGGPRTHGQKNRYRAPGSIGATAPQRVVKGRRMAGHMGVDRVTIKNLTVVKVDKENNLLLLKGAVPGHRGTLLEIRSIGNK